MIALQGLEIVEKLLLNKTNYPLKGVATKGTSLIKKLYLFNFLEEVLSHICRSVGPEGIIWTNRMIHWFCAVRSI